jgi:hypothetical protein
MLASWIRILYAWIPDNWEFTLSGFSREGTDVLELDTVPQVDAVLATANSRVSKMLANIYQVSQHHIPEDSNLNNMNLKSHLLTFFYVFEQDLALRIDFLTELFMFFSVQNDTNVVPLA